MKKVTIFDLQAKKRRGEPITMLTAYDYPTALLVERAGIDIILVGDSLGMVVLGYEGTVPVTMDEMIHHAKAVRRGASFPFLIGDMPFMSYQASVSQAVANAGRFLQEAGMDAVKLEGGREMVPAIKAIIKAGIPVMGHIGLTPQSASMLGGFKVQGRDAASAKAILDDALALEEAGCFAILLEAIPDRLAKAITERVSIPTIGIGAGPHCDGQVLIIHDLLGLFEGFKPKFVKQYINLFAQISQALERFKEDVEKGLFPAPEHCYSISDEEWAKFLALLEEK